MSLSRFGHMASQPIPDPLNMLTSIFQSRFSTVNVEDESSLSEIDFLTGGNYNATYSASAVSKKRKVVWHINGTNIFCVDISDEEIISNIYTSGTSYATLTSLVLDDERDVLYVCWAVTSNGASRLISFDVSDPTAPVELDLYYFSGSVTVWSAAIDLDAELLFTVGLGPDNSVYSFDVSDPSDITLLQKFESGTDLRGGYDIIKIPDQNLLAVSCTGAGDNSAQRIVIVNYDTPASMSINGTIANTSDLKSCYYLEYDAARKILFCGGYSSLAGDPKITTVDLSNPATPTVDTVILNASIGAMRGLAFDPNKNVLFVTSATGGNRVFSYRVNAIDSLTLIDTLTL